MLILYEVFLVQGGNPDGLLSGEVLQETQAQIMTIEEARAVGFSRTLAEGAEPHARGLEVRFIAVSPRDARFVQSRLEASHVVQSFRAHEVSSV